MGKSGYELWGEEDDMGKRVNLSLFASEKERVLVGDAEGLLLLTA